MGETSLAWGKEEKKKKKRSGISETGDFLEKE